MPNYGPTYDYEGHCPLSRALPMTMRVTVKGPTYDNEGHSPGSYLWLWGPLSWWVRCAEAPRPGTGRGHRPPASRPSPSRWTPPPRSPALCTCTNQQKKHYYQQNNCIICYVYTVYTSKLYTVQHLSSLIAALFWLARLFLELRLCLRLRLYLMLSLSLGLRIELSQGLRMYMMLSLHLMLSLYLGLRIDAVPGVEVVPKLKAILGLRCT